jgi:uncharacterized protein YacL
MFNCRHTKYNQETPQQEVFFYLIVPIKATIVLSTMEIIQSNIQKAHVSRNLLEGIGIDFIGFYYHFQRNPTNKWLGHKWNTT